MSPELERIVVLRPYAQTHCLDHQEFTLGCGRCAFAFGAAIKEVRANDGALRATERGDHG